MNKTNHTSPIGEDAANGAIVGALASLAAAISLLERGGKKAAPSDKMFKQMLSDYRKSLEEARAALTAEKVTT